MEQQSRRIETLESEKADFKEGEHCQNFSWIGVVITSFGAQITF
jgi:hypothetical protein